MHKQIENCIWKIMELLHKTDAFAESVARFEVGVCYIAK